MINRADEAFLIGGWCVASLWGMYSPVYDQDIEHLIAKSFNIPVGRYIHGFGLLLPSSSTTTTQKELKSVVICYDDRRCTLVSAYLSFSCRLSDRPLLYGSRYALATIYAALAFAELIDGLIFTEGTEERIRYFANNGSATSVVGLALYDFIVTMIYWWSTQFSADFEVSSWTIMIVCDRR
jgi:hypothetical protein